MLLNSSSELMTSHLSPPPPPPLSTNTPLTLCIKGHFHNHATCSVANCNIMEEDLSLEKGEGGGLVERRAWGVPRECSQAPMCSLLGSHPLFLLGHLLRPKLCQRGVVTCVFQYSCSIYPFPVEWPSAVLYTSEALAEGWSHIATTLVTWLSPDQPHYQPSSRSSSSWAAYYFFSNIHVITAHFVCVYFLVSEWYCNPLSLSLRAKGSSSKSMLFYFSLLVCFTSNIDYMMYPSKQWSHLANDVVVSFANSN